MQRLGEPGELIADTCEEPVLYIETAPNSWQMEPVPWLLAGFTVEFGVNDRIPTATIEISLGDPARLWDPPAGGDEQRDWLLRWSDDSLVNPRDLLGGRFVALYALGQGDSWPIFEGIIDRIELGWNGGRVANGRTLTIFATSTVIVADRLPAHASVGHWRRSRHAAITEDYKRLCRIGAPLIFNPEGQPNCDPVPLELGGGDPEGAGGGKKIYIPCDVGATGALYWTVAKLLRYLQFCSFQPAPPLSDDPPPGRYDVLDESSETWPDDDKWAEYPLRWANLSAMVETDIGFRTILEQDPNWEYQQPGLNALVRAPSNVCLDGMSLLEALAYVCDLGGLYFDAYHEAEGGEGAETLIKLSIRGWHQQIEPLPPPGGGDPEGAGGGDLEGALTRQVVLCVPADKTFGAGYSPATLIALSDAISGSLQMDESGRRNTVCARGRLTRHEVTVELNPGWKPNAWWDVDQDDPNAITEAVGRTLTPEWEGQHVANDENIDKYRIGRYWVLNEDGAFLSADYKRQNGYWSAESAWQPFNFKDWAQIHDLDARGAKGWSTRRRRFLPPLATDVVVNAPNVDRVERELDILVEISFDGGATFYSQGLCRIQVEADRCAITIADKDLREIAAEGELYNFVEAYIRRQLRVYVTAVIEGDDRVYGYSTESDPFLQLPFIEDVDRSSQFHRDLFAGVDYYASLGLTEETDETDQADRAALRFKDELATQRTAGRVTVPWLVRQYHDSSPSFATFRIGDELVAIETGDGETRIDLRTGAAGNPNLRGPVIVGMIYRWRKSPAEQSTTLMLDDRIYDAEHVFYDAPGGGHASD